MAFWDIDATEYDDDDLEAFTDDNEDEDFEEGRFSFRKLLTSFKKNKSNSDQDYDDSEDEISEETVLLKPSSSTSKMVQTPTMKETNYPKKLKNTHNEGKVLSMRGNTSSKETKNPVISRIVPTSLNDACLIIDYLQEGTAVLLILAGVPSGLAQRIFDVANGGCYTLNGSNKEIADGVFLLAPNNFQIEGDFDEKEYNDGFSNVIK